MNNDFNKQLWQLASDSPELQQAIIQSMSNASRGYSIPTGDITLSVFELEDNPRREKLIQAIHKARELTVEQLARILAELKVDLIVEEADGRNLLKQEETLMDIDITALATYALVMWLKRKTHIEQP